MHDKRSSNHDRAAARMRRRALISWPAIMFLCLCLSLFCLLSLSLSSSDQDEKESSDILSDHYQIFSARLKILVNRRRIIEQRPRICKTATSSLYTFMFFSWHEIEINSSSPPSFQLPAECLMAKIAAIFHDKDQQLSNNLNQNCSLFYNKQLYYYVAKGF